jgi:hypothetical protein
MVLRVKVGRHPCAPSSHLTILGTIQDCTEIILELSIILKGAIVSNFGSSFKNSVLARCFDPYDTGAFYNTPVRVPVYFMCTPLRAYCGRADSELGQALSSKKFTGRQGGYIFWSAT